MHLQIACAPDIKGSTEGVDAAPCLLHLCLQDYLHKSVGQGLPCCYFAQWHHLCSFTTVSFSLVREMQHEDLYGIVLQRFPLIATCYVSHLWFLKLDWKMERQQTGFSSPPEGFCCIPSTAPPAGKAVLQTTFQSKILCKSFITRSVPVHTFYTTHHFQLMTSFPQRLHIQMADLAVISFLTFFFLFSTFPPHHFWRPLQPQNLPCESESAMSLLKTDMETQILTLFRFQIIQILRMLSLAPESI